MKYYVKHNDVKKENDFYEKIIRHLVDYKENKLGINESGDLYNYNKKTCEAKNAGEKEWVLPLNEGMKNYMCEDAVNISRQVDKGSKWYHLNSTTTMTINFFAPLIKDNYKNLNRLISSLVHKDIKINNHLFNYLDGEDETLINFFCTDKEDHKYYFTINYSARHGFSKAPTQSPYKTFEEIYRPMIENSTHLQYLLKDDYWKEFMYCHFKVYRNMIIANEETGNYSFFITLKANDYTREELRSAESDAFEKYKNFKPIFWESLIITCLNIFKDDEDLINYFTEFKDKYIV